MNLAELNSALMRLAITYTKHDESAGMLLDMSPAIHGVPFEVTEAWETVRRAVGLPVTPEEVAEQLEQLEKLQRLLRHEPEQKENTDDAD